MNWIWKWAKSSIFACGYNVQCTWNWKIYFNFFHVFAECDQTSFFACGYNVRCPWNWKIYFNFFHAFAGCDQTSFFTNCLKKVLGQYERILVVITETFIKLESAPTKEDIKGAISILEPLVVLDMRSSKQLP